MFLCETTLTLGYSDGKMINVQTLFEKEFAKQI